MCLKYGYRVLFRKKGDNIKYYDLYKKIDIEDNKYSIYVFVVNNITDKEIIRNVIVPLLKTRSNDFYFYGNLRGLWEDETDLIDTELGYTTDTIALTMSLGDNLTPKEFLKKINKLRLTKYYDKKPRICLFYDDIEFINKVKEGVDENE